MTIQAGIDQAREAVFIRRLDVGAAGEELAHNVELTAQAGVDQARGAVIIRRRLDVGAAG